MYARARFHGLPLASARVPVHMDTYEHTKMEFRFFFVVVVSKSGSPCPCPTYILVASVS